MPQSETAITHRAFELSLKRYRCCGTEPNRITSAQTHTHMHIHTIRCIQPQRLSRKYESTRVSL